MSQDDKELEERIHRARKHMDRLFNDINYQLSNIQIHQNGHPFLINYI